MPIKLPREPGDPPLNVIIVGGSLTGLMHGLMLKRAGHNVRILDQILSSSREGQAAGIGVADDARDFMEKYDLLQEAYGQRTTEIRITDAQMNVVQSIPEPRVLSGWDVLYYRLRANYDGYASTFCPHPPCGLPTDGTAVYDLGKRVTDVQYDGASSQVTVYYHDLFHGGSSSAQADLVIGADGGYSTVRRRMLPNDEKRYSGWVAWRGVVPEREVSMETREYFDRKLSVTSLGGTYLVMYMLPGEAGTLAQGERLMNFVWYTNMQRGSEEFKAAMTDVEGCEHMATLPVGKMAPEVWKKQKTLGRTLLPRPFLEILEAVDKPFITACYDTAAAKAVFYEGALLLVGDALALTCPNLGASTNQGALNCLRLTEVLDGQKTMQQWEQEVLEHGEQVRAQSLAFGRRFLG